MACETMRVDGDFSLDYIAGKQHLAEIIEKKSLTVPDFIIQFLQK